MEDKRGMNKIRMFDLDGLKKAINSLIGPYIYVTSIEEVDDDFHARFNVKRKTYKYIINCGEYNPIERNYVYQYGKELGVDKMKKEIKSYLGIHDFKSFVSKDDINDSYEREIYDAHIDVIGDKIYIYFTGSGFMKYQVRNMVGVLFKIGKGKLDLGIVDKIFEDPSNEKVISTMAREGLYLEKIEY